MIGVEVNGRRQVLADGATLQTVLTALDVEPTQRGLAVAVDAEVVPRSRWSQHPLAEGSRIEVLTAMQGG